MENPDEIEPYQNLANAIIAAAAHDYAQAIVDESVMREKSNYDFFHGTWFRILTRAEPEYILRTIRERAEEFKGKAQEILESLHGPIEKPFDAFICPVCGYNVRARKTTAYLRKEKGMMIQGHYNIIKCTWCDLEMKKYLFTRKRMVKKYGKNKGRDDSIEDRVQAACGEDTRRD